MTNQKLIFNLFYLLIVNLSLLNCEFQNEKKINCYSIGAVNLCKFEKPISNLLVNSNLIVACERTVYFIKNKKFKDSLPINQVYNLNSENTVLTKLNDDDILVCGANHRNNVECYNLSIKNDKLVGKIFKNNFNLLGNQNFYLLPLSSNGTSYALAKAADAQDDLYLSEVKLNAYKNQFHIVNSRYKFIRLNKNFIKDFEIHLVYAFKWHNKKVNYAFVLKRERKNEEQLITKLGRVDLDDYSFQSYTEIPLICVDAKTGQEFSYTQSAYFNDDKLFVAFNSYDYKHEKVNKFKGSILCSFTFEQLNNFYKNTIRQCNLGNTKDAKQMIHYGLIYDDYDKKEYCSNNKPNQYIESKINLNGSFQYKFENEIITSLISYKSSEKKSKQLYILGTSEGKILELINYDNSTISNKSPINVSNERINSNPIIYEDNVHFVSGNSLIIYPLANYSNKDLKSNLEINDFITKKSFVLFFTILIISSLLFLSFKFLFALSPKKTKPILPLKRENENNKIPLVQIENFYRKKILIPIYCLKLENRIGNGHFGCVYKAKLTTSDGCYQVAIKKLKNSSNKAELLEEASIMIDFKHKNVLTLIGVCLEDDSSPMIVLPFMANGDLLTFIRSEKSHLTVRNLLNFAIQIGKGMNYLSQIKYVHRDLAARNCMIDEHNNIKVADFGLTRDIYDYNYYRSKNSKPIPFKWMSIESIKKSIFTSKSDVWSFGILLWELMTKGDVPYPTLDIDRVLDFLENEQRMKKPETCPAEIYELMLDCWQLDFEARPSFDKIVARIETLIDEEKAEFEIAKNLSQNVYYNDMDNYLIKKDIE